MVQRRLGLPLTAQVPEGERSRHGRERCAFDVMGDLATNDGKSGHQSRHHSVLVELVTRLRSSWGSAVKYEPAGYKGYSDTRRAEFDATTWSARTWTSFTMQRISCALMVAVAWELAGAMGLASVGDTRDDDE